MNSICFTSGKQDQIFIKGLSSFVSTQHTMTPCGTLSHYSPQTSLRDIITFQLLRGSVLVWAALAQALECIHGLSCPCVLPGNYAAETLNRLFTPRSFVTELQCSKLKFGSRVQSVSTTSSSRGSRISSVTVHFRFLFLPDVLLTTCEFKT